MTVVPVQRLDRRSWMVLGALLLLQILLIAKTWDPTPQTGGDNAGYIALAQSLKHGQYRDIWDPAQPLHTKYPPVFPALITTLPGVGAGLIASIKLLCAAMAVASSFLVFLWVRRRSGLGTAVAVGGLVAMSPVMLEYSHLELSEMPFLLFTWLALWAFDNPSPRRWMTVVGVGAAVLGYFTRSAGLPLIVAAVAALWMSGRKRTTLTLLAAFAIPALLWMIRAKLATQGTGQYANEFWMKDPYDPSLGTASMLDVVGRIPANIGAYLTKYIPEALPGSIDPASRAPLAIGIVGFAVVGLWKELRQWALPALFVVLYLGLLTLWPLKFSEVRFVLPVVALLVYYCIEGARVLGKQVGAGLARAVPAIVAAILVVAGAGRLTSTMGASADCRAAVATSGQWGCLQPNVGAYFTLLESVRGTLEPNAVIVSRKPRSAWLLSGYPSQIFPFFDAPDSLIAAANRYHAQYVTMDLVDGISMRYQNGAILAAPERFCIVNATADGMAVLLRIRPTPAPKAIADGTTHLPVPCPADLLPPAKAAASRS